MLLPILLAPPDSGILARYVQARVPVRKPTISTEKGDTELKFTSGTWHGSTWRHTVLWRVPKGAKTDTAILYITGDGPRPGDYRDIALLSGATGMPIAMLFDVPNQPIEGRKEDDLIAHSFAKFLETGDRTWPALLPMTRAAVSAMDAIQTIAPVKKFVVTGGSKRGWTTWLAAATGDKRIAGIAPMVFDNLNFDLQLPRQLELWGKYSDQIQDYTRRGLQTQMATPRGRELISIVDPWTYRNRIRVPKMIVNGANDPYWATDAFRNYKDGLKGPVYLSTTPNAGHDLGPKLPAIAAIGAFARSVAGGFAMPKLAMRESVTGGAFSVELTAPEAVSVTLWQAASKTTDFRDSTWEKTVLPISTGKLSYVFQPSPDPVAAFFEVGFTKGGRPFSLCTPTKILPGTQP